MRKGKTVEEYILVDEKWQSELLLLREIILESELDETIKWGCPVYTIIGKNVLGVAAFKNYVGVWFYQGVFLKDEARKLFNAQDGKTKALRQWRFSSLSEIQESNETLKLYIEEAIENQRLGKEIKPSKKKEVLLPAELKEALGNNSILKEQYESLSQSKQREYAEYVGSAKQEATRLRRLQKIIPMIEAGIGLNDKYRSC